MPTRERVLVIGATQGTGFPIVQRLLRDVRNMGTGAAILVGIVLALLLYAFVFYGMTPVWPWFANARNWVSIFAHVVFGAVVAWWYKARSRPADEHAHV